MQVVWGLISMVDAEKRLLANALEDVDNQVFILLSDSCVPLHSFDYVYNYLMGTNVSFIDCFKDPGPHGSGRYSIEMYPEIDERDFRKGAQWFAVTRRHALMILADSLYYKKFKLYCKVCCGIIIFRNYLSPVIYSQQKGATVLQMSIICQPCSMSMVDPGGISNWSVTHVDWSEGKWHPRSYSADDVTYDLLKNITAVDENFHVTSDDKKLVMQKPCLWNGSKRPCYLFARKFNPEALDNLLKQFTSYTSV
ncbi:Core-2/I-branching beta-16-N-acetylglucosaminyltransferase family protein [Zea mays]|uniref:Core-2/I-branching beta-16-N-acetylglucosaminyltransferase family protein n=1 Tax=Zea mays TaxID=4577 RepID=A0A1D6P5J0_MAIZE|nr:Core-2/I-branching beta-16-N-acetylglucosaminyltransferase family protein [Zea mays]